MNPDTGSARSRLLGAWMMAVAAGFGSGSAAGQLWTDLNRVFLADAFSLHAIRLDGTIDWQVPLPVVDSVAGLVVDGHGFVWLADMPYARLLRYDMAGQLSLTVPIPGPTGTMIRMPAVDRDGNCYVGKLVPDPVANFGFRHWLVKVGAQGNILWELDLTPQLATSLATPSPIDEVRVDEDGHVWVSMSTGLSASQVSGFPTFGRLVRVSPQGAVEVSVTPGGWGLQVNPNRTVRVFAGPSFLFDFNGTYLSTNPQPNTGYEAFTHASNARMVFVSNYLYGQQSSPLTGLGFPSLPTAALFPGSGPQSPTVPRNAAPDGNGQLWMFASDYVTQLVSAIHLGNCPLPCTVYPWQSSTLLSTVIQPTTWYRGTYNEGNRFTVYDWCLVVDPWGDLDGDGVMNRNEIMEGTNPSDPASVSLSLTVSGLGIGQTATFAIAAPAQPGRTYLSLASTNPLPHRLNDARAFGPNLFDPLANLWLLAGPPAVVAQSGVLDGAGQAAIQAAIPADPALVGAGFRFGCLTLETGWSQGIRTLFGPTLLTIGP